MVCMCLRLFVFYGNCSLSELQPKMLRQRADYTIRAIVIVIMIVFVLDLEII